VAREIVSHIHNLIPPGRFLKRMGRTKNYRGLEGPWEELTEQEVIKKTCQALRDCNRQDRAGYAAAVAVPDDVRQDQVHRSQTGMSNKEYAEKAAAETTREVSLAFEQQAQQVQQAQAQFQLPEYNESAKRPHIEVEPIPSINGGSISPSIEQGAHWLKKQRLDDADTTPHASTTPTTAASSGGMLQDRSLMDSVPSSTASHPHDPQGCQHDYLGHEHQHNMPLSPVKGQVHHHSLPDSPIAGDPAHHMPTFDHLGAAFHDSFARRAPSSNASVENFKMNANNFSADFDPLHLAVAAIENGDPYASHQQEFLAAVGDEFAPPSPLHPDHNHQHQNHQHQHHHHHHHHNGEELTHDRFGDI
jgi:hypothetical protein